MARTDDNRPRLSAYDQAVKLLARRDHAEAELRRKLRQREYTRGEIDDAIALLHADHYLDDHRTAALWAEQEARRGGQGREKALQRMIQHGIAPELARAALEELWDDEFEREQAAATLAKLLRTLTPEQRQGPSGRARIARRLASRGFNAEVVRDLVSRLSDDDFPEAAGSESDPG